MVELSSFSDSILPPINEMATAVTDSLNYHLSTAKGQSVLHDLHSSLTTAGIDTPGFPTEAALTTDGPDGVGATAVGSEADTFTDTRKAVLSLYATILHKVTIPLMPQSLFHTPKPPSTEPTSRPA
jgi:hypothetical protein